MTVSSHYGVVDPISGKSSVLVVDDTPSNLMALSAVLGPLGVRVVQAQSGPQALERVRDEEFAVVLLDVQMPGMDGFEVATRIRATDNGRELPIIFLTALHRDEAFVRRGYAVGAADYLTKPFDADVLRARVKAFVDLFQQREAIRREQVAERTRERDEAMRRAVAFERIATAALEINDLSAFLRELLQVLLSVSEAADSATILLRTGDELVVRASVVANHEKTDEPFRVRIGTGFAGRIAATRRPLEISESADAQPLLESVVTARGSRALFGVPLQADGDVLGVAHVGSARAPSFPERDKRLVLAIAERAAWAVSKHQQRARVHDIVHAAPALIAIFHGPERTLELANPTYEKFFIGSRNGELNEETTLHPSIAHALSQVHDSGDPVFVPELPIVLGDDTRFVNLSAQPLTGPTGVRDSVLVFAVDVSAEVRARRQIEAHQSERARLLERERIARQQAETASRSKDEFLATISHELRTPLNAVIGWTARARTKAPPEVDRALAIIERNAQSQARIIEDMLDLSRIISGRLRLEVRPTSLREPILGAVEAVRPAAEAKGVTLEVDNIDGAGALEADPDRLQQVIWNLLSNAIKFTPRGGHVWVRVKRDPDRMTVQVIDTGEGMDPRFLPMVFEPFRQADGSTTRRHGGLGLGLAIVRQLVHAHGGNARVSSPGLGHGSTFEVELPLRPPTAAMTEETLELTEDEGFERTPSEGPRLDGLKVMVVDDEEDARTLLVEVLTERGARVVSAESVAHALAQFDSFKPDVLVSDIGMPEADGYMLIRQVRELPTREARNIPAIALTAYARAEDVARSFEAGFQRHLAKPVDAERLIGIIASLAPQGATASH